MTAPNFLPSVLTVLPHYLYPVVAEISLSPICQKVQSSAEREETRYTSVWIYFISYHKTLCLSGHEGWGQSHTHYMSQIVLRKSSLVEHITLADCMQFVTTTAIPPSGANAKQQGSKPNLSCTETTACPSESVGARNASSFKSCYRPGRC